MQNSLHELMPNSPNFIFEGPDEVMDALNGLSDSNESSSSSSENTLNGSHLHLSNHGQHHHNMYHHQAPYHHHTHASQSLDHQTSLNNGNSNNTTNGSNNGLNNGLNGQSQPPQQPQPQHQHQQMQQQPTVDSKRKYEELVNPLEKCDVTSASGSANKKQAPANGKKTKGRVKIKMEFIDNKLRRYTTFSKRKTGIMKKAYELSTLTGTQVMLLVASETGHVYTFATRKLQPMITSEAGKALIQTCLNTPDLSNVSNADQRMCATGFEETELTYTVNEENSSEKSPSSCCSSNGLIPLLTDDSGTSSLTLTTQEPESRQTT